LWIKKYLQVNNLKYLGWEIYYENGKVIKNNYQMFLNNGNSKQRF